MQREIITAAAPASSQRPQWISENSAVKEYQKAITMKIWLQAKIKMVYSFRFDLSRRVSLPLHLPRIIPLKTHKILLGHQDTW